MSRVIKFRYVARHEYAGDIRLFTHVLDLHSIEDTIDVIDLICSEIDPCTCCFNESQNHCDCDSILDHGEFEIISRDQFTGLKDKNGVEIYEGDIVRSDSHGSTSIVSVSFFDGIFVANGGLIKNIRIGGGYVNEYSFKVIGNIHQNPELLSD